VKNEINTNSRVNSWCSGYKLVTMQAPSFVYRIVPRRRSCPKIKSNRSRFLRLRKEKLTSLAAEKPSQAHRDQVAVTLGFPSGNSYPLISGLPAELA